MKLSAVIVNRNYAKTLVKTLESLNFVDEIVFCDMESTDNSVEIAKKYQAKIFTHKQVGFADPARNFALSKAQGEWILVLDSDEYVSTTLKEKIIEIINNTQTADAYKIPRQNIVFGSAMKKSAWWPDYQIRLFKNGKVTWPNYVHGVPVVKGTLNEFKPKVEFAIIHDNYRTVEDYLNRFNLYTSLEVNKIKEEKITPSRLFQLFTDEFFFRFFKKEGLEDGLKGVSLSLGQGMYQVFAYLKKWQKLGAKEVYNDQADTILELRKFQKDLNYWIADWHAKKNSGFKKLYWQIRRKFKV